MILVLSHFSRQHGFGGGVCPKALRAPSVDKSSQNTSEGGSSSGLDRRGYPGSVSDESGNDLFPKWPSKPDPRTPY